MIAGPFTESEADTVRLAIARELGYADQPTKDNSLPMRAGYLMEGADGSFYIGIRDASRDAARLVIAAEKVTVDSRPVDQTPSEIERARKVETDWIRANAVSRTRLSRR